MSHIPSLSDEPREKLARDRTSMANFRTQLALDRTTLAWVRTALAMTSFGFGMVAFFRSLRHEKPDPETIRLHLHATRMGTALLFMGVVTTLLAGGTHWLSLRRLRQGKLPSLKRWPTSIMLALVFAIVGLIGLWAVFVL